MSKKVNDPWELKRIDEIADVNPRLNKAGIPDDLDVSFVPMPAVSAGSGQIDVSGSRLFATVKKGFTAFAEGDVLFAKITPCMENGKMAVVPEVQNGYGFGSTEFHVLRPKTSVLSQYVYYFVSSKQFLGEAERYMTGAVGQKRVTTTYLKEQEIPVPGISYQKKIVEEIEKQFSRLDEAVANLKRVKANLKRYKASVLQAAVTGKLTEEWRKNNSDVEPASKLLERILTERHQKWEETELARLRERHARGQAKIDENWQPKNDKRKEKYKEPAAPDVSGLPELPDGWAHVGLGLVIDEPKYGTSKKCNHESGNYGVLRIPNVANGKVDDSDLKFADFEPNEVETYRISENDLLIIRSNGSVSLVGKAALVSKGDTKYLYAGYLIRLRSIDSVINGGFLINAISSNVLRQQIERVAKSTSGVNNINAQELKSLIIPVCGLEEQQIVVQEIEGRLSVAEEIERTVDANLKRAERLRQSILKQAFSGKLVSF